jgi:site-specific recombinase XerC
MEYTHIGLKVDWLHVGYKGTKARDINVINAAQQPLNEYIYHSGRDPESSYTFTSQRSRRLTVAGINRWWKNIKAQANVGEWEHIHDVTFDDLRHDFAQQAREAGWTLEEVTYYLGHLTKKGTPAIQTKIWYTQSSRQQVKDKLTLLKG